MSYTAPQYVDTKEQAILALASTIKGEAVTGGDGSVNRALDILADVLAEQDVQVPQTDAGAILALADYVSGGGGGGGSTSTITIFELLHGDASDQLKLTIETIDGEPVEATLTTIIVEGDELPAFTFDVDAGAVVTLTADDGLTFNDLTCMYGSGLDEPVETVYPFSIDQSTSATMMLVATSTDSYVVAEIASKE